MGYREEAEMTDVLIRDVPDDVIAALDTHAARLGLSRSEYVRRRLAQDAATPGSPVSVEDLARLLWVAPRAPPPPPRAPGLVPERICAAPPGPGRRHSRLTGQRRGPGAI